MTTATFECPGSFASSPGSGAAGSGTYMVRQTVKGVHDALVACGFVRTADTGQLDPATVVRPTAAPNPVGYEVWRFDDALQAMHPLVFRLDYALTSGGGAIGLQVTVGKGSDGTGGITGVLVAPPQMRASGVDAAVLTGYVSSGDGSMLALCGWGSPSATAQPCGVIIDRSRAHDGAPTGDGVAVAVRGTGDLAVHTNTSGAESAARDAALYCAAYDSAASSVGQIPVAVPYLIDGVPLDAGAGPGGGVLAPVFPWACFVPGEAPWQALAAISFAGSDVSAGVMTVRVAGADRTYRFLPLQATASWGQAYNPLQPSNSITAKSRAVGLAILWE